MASSSKVFDVGEFDVLGKFSYWSNHWFWNYDNFLWFSFDWSEIRKSKIPPSEFCPISGDWGKLGIPNLEPMSLIKCYWMLQNSRVTAYNLSELLRENQQGVKLPPTQIRIKTLILQRFHYFTGNLHDVRIKWSKTVKSLCKLKSKN